MGVCVPRAGVGAERGVNHLEHCECETPKNTGGGSPQKAIYMYVQ